MFPASPLRQTWAHVSIVAVGASIWRLVHGSREIRSTGGDPGAVMIMDLGVASLLLLTGAATLGNRLAACVFVGDGYCGRVTWFGKRSTWPRTTLREVAHRRRNVWGVVQDEYRFLQASGQTLFALSGRSWNRSDLRRVCELLGVVVVEARDAPTVQDAHHRASVVARALPREDGGFLCSHCHFRVRPQDERCPGCGRHRSELHAAEEQG